jgi:hypothetical protein
MADTEVPASKATVEAIRKRCLMVVMVVPSVSRGWQTGCLRSQTLFSGMTEL